MNKIKSCITFENIIGLIFAILIICEFNFETEIKKFINTPVGTILMFVLGIFLFMYYNPLVSLLFFIFIYDNIKDSIFYNSQIFEPSDTNKNIMKNLNNVNKKDKNLKDIEISIIKNMSPIVKKYENINAKFKPNPNDNLKFSKI